MLAKDDWSLAKTLSTLHPRNEHLVVLAKSCELDRLVDVLAFLALGRVPPEVVEFLRGGLILPQSKDGGGYRPLTIANVMRRAALRAFIAMNRKRAAEAVGSCQYGVARKSGADLLYKSIQATLAARPDYGVLAIDFQAAFQNISREELQACAARR